MFSPMNDRQKNAVSIASFGGYNHTDLTQPGEWYEMKNLSGRYLPLLTPRRSRDKLTTLDGSAKAVIYKNDYYIYSDANGTIYYRREVNHEPGELFINLGNDTTHTLYVSGSNKVYRFLEMGNKILCLNENRAHIGYITFGVSPSFQAIEQSIELSAKAVNNEAELFSPGFYYLHSNENGVYESVLYDAQGNSVKTVNGLQPGTSLNYDGQSENFLNIGFRYAVEENGKITVLRLGHLCTESEVAAFTESQYYMGKDKKLFRYDAESESSTEITAPLMAMFIRAPIESITGITPVRAELPESGRFKSGDYVNMTIGRCLNLSSPYAWENTDSGYSYINTDSYKGQLRVLSYDKYSDEPELAWTAAQGWDCHFIFEYNAAFTEWIVNHNLIHDTEHYSRELAAKNNAGVSHTDTENGNTTVPYPQFENGEVSAQNLNLPTVGSEKFYPESLNIVKEFPKLEAPIEHNNRIWGCNNTNNEIKACAQGNFENWDEYRGLVSDSYAVSVGSDGAFTASCVIDDYLFFLKENSYICVYGTRPSNFCTNTVEDFIGIRATDANSLQVIGKSAYYMGVDGRVYRFNGSDSVCISQVFGDERYTVLDSAHSQDKYYLHLQKGDEKLLFVYHTTTGVWFIEDADYLNKIQNIRNQAVAFIENSSLHTSGNRPEMDIVLLDKWNIPETEQNTVEWECVSGLFGLESDFYQFISNLKLTYQSEVGAFIEVLVQYDEGNDWEPVFKEVSDRKQTKTAKIRVKRCAFMRLKIRGKGFSKIFRITYLKEQGSEK